MVDITSVRKALIAAGGRGTRFYPITSVIPKELLPIINKPVIHLAVEECIACGITDIVIVVSPEKCAIARYFTPNILLEICSKYKCDPHDVSLRYVIQEEALGLGHAVSLAESTIGDVPFALLLPDDVFEIDKMNLLEMARLYDEYEGSVIATSFVNSHEVERYGIIVAERISENFHRVNALVEKPSVDKAPSRMAVFGRYILSPGIFDILRETGPGTGGEIQMTDALARFCTKQPVFAFEFKGRRLDCGTVLGWIQANIRTALLDDSLSAFIHDDLSAI